MQIQPTTAFLDLYQCPHKEVTNLSMDPEQLYATVERKQQEDMEFRVNQAYAATPNIPVEPNQCYMAP